MWSGLYSYCHKLQALVYDSLPPTTAIVDYAIGLEKLLANSFFNATQTTVSLYRQLRLYQMFLLYWPRCLCQHKLSQNHLNWDRTFFLPGTDESVYMGAMLFPQSYKYPNLSEGTDHISGQMQGDKECPFSGITSSGRVWRKVPESDARSVLLPLALMFFFFFWLSTSIALD